MKRTGLSTVLMKVIVQSFYARAMRATRPATAAIAGWGTEAAPEKGTGEDADGTFEVVYVDMVALAE